jgi:putative transport protein
MRELNTPRLLPIFVGIAMGVVLGSIPVTIPGVPAAVKLGLAAGPMIVAILLARVGRVGRLIWFMPQSASQLLRELGIVLFLIAVGLQAGDGFFDTLKTPLGLYWLGLGALVTLIPLLIVGVIARAIFKVNYLHACGMLCGSMTSPSLAFVHTFTTSEAPAVAFATVYPLSMVLRVLVAQLIVLIFH